MANQEPFSFNRNRNVGEKAPHAGDIPRELGGERPIREFDKTPLTDAVEQGLVQTPESTDHPALQKVREEAPVTPYVPHTREVQKGRKTRLSRRVIAGLTGAAVFGGGAAVGLSVFGGSEDDQSTDRKQDTSSLVLGPDGEPLQYVEYSSEHSDRDNDGSDDARTDMNQNGITDYNELWDQESEKFVTPEEAGQLDDALENATEEDLANISEIESTIPDFSSVAGVNWKADFVALDPIVKDRVMYALHHPESYPGSDLLAPEQQWRADVAYQFKRTPEDILE